MLWSGGFHSFNGKHLQLEDARIYDLPDELPEIIVAASGTNAARIAAEHGGMFTTAPDANLVNAHRKHGGSGTIFGELVIAYDPASKDSGLRRPPVRPAGQHLGRSPIGDPAGLGLRIRHPIHPAQ